MITKPLLDSIQNGTLRYTYKDVPMWKNPIDLALYAILITKVRPRTIIEVGSNAGGSALWFSDQMAVNGIEPNVFSVDVNPPREKLLGVTFLKGDANDLSATLNEVTIASPVMLSEDADHLTQTTLAVLRWWGVISRPGEYAVIEDGNVNEIYPDRANVDGGPLAAIRTFIDEQAGAFEVDRALCDWFGKGVTFNTDGYIRRVR